MGEKEPTISIEVTHKETFFNLFKSDRGIEIVHVLDAYFNARNVKYTPEEQIYKELIVNIMGTDTILMGFNKGDYERGIEYLRRNYSVYYVPPTIRKQHEDSLKKKDEEITSFLNAIVQYKKTIRDLEVKLSKEKINPFEKQYSLGTLDDIYQLWLYLDELNEYIAQEKTDLLNTCRCSSMQHDILGIMDNRLIKLLERNGYFDEGDDNE